MSIIYMKMVAIALWCGNPVNHTGNMYAIYISPKAVNECRIKLQQCSQGKETHLQAESCFMGTKLGK